VCNGHVGNCGTSSQAVARSTSTPQEPSRTTTPTARTAAVIEPRYCGDGCAAAIAARAAARLTSCGQPKTPGPPARRYRATRGLTRTRCLSRPTGWTRSVLMTWSDSHPGGAPDRARSRERRHLDPRSPCVVEHRRCATCRPVRVLAGAGPGAQRGVVTQRRVDAPSASAARRRGLCRGRIPACVGRVDSDPEQPPRRRTKSLWRRPTTQTWSHQGPVARTPDPSAHTRIGACADGSQTSVASPSALAVRLPSCVLGRRRAPTRDASRSLRRSRPSMISLIRRPEHRWRCW